MTKSNKSCENYSTVEEVNNTLTTEWLCLSGEPERKAAEWKMIGFSLGGTRIGRMRRQQNSCHEAHAGYWGRR